MSYTILTIPFNLKEKEGGEFLKKGFVFDDIFEKYLSEVKNQEEKKRDEYKIKNQIEELRKFESILEKKQNQSFP